MSTPDPLLPSAAERLAMSRERLRQTMVAAMPPARATPRALGALPSWLQNLESIPAVAVVVDAVRGWWAHHPLRLTTLVAADAGKTLIRPLAERYPLGLVAGALLVGGLLAWGRPWRRFIKPALFAGLLPAVISKVVANVPVESWMSIMEKFTKPQKASASAASNGSDAPPEPEAPITPPTPRQSTEPLH